MGIKQCPMRHPDTIKPQLAIVHTIAAHLVAHVLNAHTRHSIATIVTNSHQKPMDALMLVANVQLCHHHRPVGMHCRVGDPVLLCQGRWGVENKLVGCCIIVCSGAHLYSIVAIAKLCQCKAPNVCERINAIDELVMVLGGAQLDDRATKQVELHCHFGGHGHIAPRSELVCSKYDVGIVVEVAEAKDVGCTQGFEAGKGELTLFLEGDIVSTGGMMIL